MGVLALSIVLPFQAWLTVPVSSIAVSFGGNLSAGVPNSIDASVPGMSGIYSALIPVVAATLSPSSPSLSGVASSLNGGAFNVAVLFWTLALILFRVAYPRLRRYRGRGDRAQDAQGDQLAGTLRAFCCFVATPRQRATTESD